MLRNHAMRIGLAGTFTALALFALASSSMAAEVVRMSNAELTRRAEVILQGTVKTTTPRVGIGSFIYTDVTLDVTAFIKSGDATQKTFTFSTLGGTLEGRTFTFAGNTKFAEGEDVILFLDAPNPKTGCRYTVGVAQGKFTIKKDDQGKAYVERDLGGTTFVGEKHAEPEKPSTGPKLYLDDFLKEIKGYLQKK